MKRFTGILAAAAIAIAPMSASALEALTDNAMNDVTAQAGVSIALDDIVIYQTGIADTTYTDTDGMSSFTAGNLATTPPNSPFTTEGNVASAGIMIDYADAMQKLTIIDGILSDTDKSGKYSATTLAGIFTPAATGTTTAAPQVGFYAAGEVAAAVDWTNGNNADDDYRTGASPLTIDIGTCQSLTAGFAYNQGGTSSLGDIAGVIIGLPTIEIQSFHTTDTKTIKLVDAVAADGTTVAAGNSDRAFIQITKSGTSTMAILGGRLEIAPH